VKETPRSSTASDSLNITVPAAPKFTASGAASTMNSSRPSQIMPRGNPS
jgi:hypothetical protein